jgi:hypothetical protein
MPNDTTPTPIELEFETYFEGYFYLVSYESDSVTRNRVQTITTMDVLPVDVERLPKQWPKLWQHIKWAIANNADSHYNKEKEVLHEA